MKKNNLVKWMFILPIIIYTVFLIALPILYIIIISFFKSDSYGGMIHTVTLQNYIELFDVVYLKIFLKSALIAIVTTVICVLISYPFVLAVSHKSKKTQQILMTLVMVPFLTNSLIRMYGWIVLLRKSGVINSLLLGVGAFKEPLSLMYNTFGIIVGMIYTLLPFMILPLYSSVSTIKKYPSAGVNTIKAPLNNPGIVWGNITFLNIFHLLAPKSLEASKSDLSIVDTELYKGSIINGSNVYTIPIIIPNVLYISESGSSIIFKLTNKLLITPDFLKSTIHPYILISELVRNGTITRVINICCIFLLLCDIASTNGYDIKIHITVVIIAIKADFTNTFK